MKKMFLLFVLLTFVSSNMLAQEAEKKLPVRFLIGGALEFGGDEVAKIYFTNGEDQSVRAGQGGSVFVGGQFQLPKEPRLLFRATLGFKYVTTQADNVHIRLTRIPLIASANWMITDKIRLGAGIVSHQNIKFKADGIGQDITFGGANGPIFEVAYRGIGLTYALMKYKDQSNVTYSANAIGISFSTTIQKPAGKKGKKPISPMQQK